ncbi:hypothetical protein SB783_44490, partial [Paraburkholderia sp. SIMBA_009]
VATLAAAAMPAASHAARATDKIGEVENMALTVMGRARAAAGQPHAPRFYAVGLTAARNTRRPRDFRARDELGYLVT